MAQLIWTDPPSGPNTTISLTSGQYVSAGDIVFRAGTLSGGAADRYELFLGSLPPGLAIEGELTDTEITIAGTPSNVAIPTYTRMILRAYDDFNNTYIDGTFNFVVSPDATYPRFTTPEGNIANISTGINPASSTNNTQVSINYQEIAQGTDVKVSLVNGQLPPGLDIDYANLGGILSAGQVGANIEIPILGTAFYSNEYANSANAEFSNNSYIKPWEFTLEVEDSFQANTANFRINVYAREFLNASADGGNVANVIYANLRPQIAYITADSDKGTATDPIWPPAYYTGNTFPANFRFGADSSSRYAPWITRNPGSVGSSISENFFAQEITVETREEDAVPKFYLAAENPDDMSPSLLPLGMELDPVTGYIWGRPRVIRDTTFKFTIGVEDGAYPGYPSREITYNLLVSAAAIVNVNWLQPSFLGEIDNGSASEFLVSATTPLDTNLWYQLSAGSMPPGLNILENGLIVGRTIFDTPAPSQDYDFWITVYGVNSGISATRKFTIRVNHRYAVPFNNVYIQCYPNSSQRSLIDNILQDYVILQPNFIYRLGDPNFGINKELRFLHAVNLNVATDQAFADAMLRNHYRKQVGVGPFKSARARSQDGSIRYEVIYCEIIDPLINPSGESESSRVNLNYPADYGNTVYTSVYPNTLEAMRRRLYERIGQAQEALPLWMTSIQSNGTALGYLPAWVVAHTLPGYGESLAFQLNRAWGERLPLIDFDIDRYVLDNALTYRYNAANRSWDNARNVSGSSLSSPIAGISGNIIVMDVDYSSQVPSLRSGDTISWSSGNNSANTVMLVTSTVYSPVVGRLGDNPNSDGNTLTITNPGSGYNAARPPAILFSQPDLTSGRVAQAVANVNLQGQIDEIRITEAGLGYHKVPTVTIDLPDDSNPANRASAVANIRLSPVFDFSVIKPGRGYEPNPIVPSVGNVTFTVSPPPQDPLNPTANIQLNTAIIDYCTLSNTGGVTGVTILPGHFGQYYTSPPFVTVSPPPDLNQANAAVVRSSIRYQLLAGNIGQFTSSGNVYLFNRYTTLDELDKYYLFPQVNILQ